MHHWHLFYAYNATQGSYLDKTHGTFAGVIYTLPQATTDWMIWGLSKLDQLFTTKGCVYLCDWNVLSLTE